MKITCYEDLLVWQEAMSLVEECYHLTANFPRNEEFGLKSQMSRAAVSVPSNIGEGHDRQHTKEFIQMLSIALGSLAECETQLEVSRRMKLISEDNLQTVSLSCRKVGKMINGLKNSLAQHSSGQKAAEAQTRSTPKILVHTGP